MANLARDLGVPELELRRKVEGLREFNPMLGHRGSRLAITYPEIYEMQVRAIIEAACVCADSGLRTQPEIMLPLVAGTRELARAARAGRSHRASAVMKERGRRRSATASAR